MFKNSDLVCPRCRHQSWEGEMTIDSCIQHCAKCKETFTINIAHTQTNYFYSNALIRLNTWKSLRKNKKISLFLKLKLILKAYLLNYYKP